VGAWRKEVEHLRQRNQKQATARQAAEASMARERSQAQATIVQLENQLRLLQSEIAGMQVADRLVDRIQAVHSRTPPPSLYPLRQCAPV
jgi:hypothetical protein